MKLNSLNEIEAGDLLQIHVYGDLQPRIVIYLGLCPWKSFSGRMVWDRKFFDVKKCSTYYAGVSADELVRDVWLWARL